MSSQTAELSQEDALELVRGHLRRELSLADVPIIEDTQLDLLPGADSVRLMRVVASLERELDVEFDDDRIRAADTVGDLVGLVLATVTAAETAETTHR